MNRILLALLMLLPLSAAFGQQKNQPEQVTGTWNGALSIGGTRLPLVIHIATDESGSLTATMDSPQQGAKGIPVQGVKATQDSLYLNIRAIGGTYAGKFSGPETIDGYWKQGAQSFPMQLTKGAAEALRRPQEPVKPYPYREQEVTVENKAAGIRLAGTLTLPQGKAKHPAVILFTGSGSQDRDMALLGHKPFLVLADHLTRQGFAVLRLDDRGAGKSGGSAAMATTQDFASDAQAAYTFLKSQKEINPKKIGLLGLSEGALIAAQIAAANQEVAFVVLLAGNGVPGTELLVAQNEAIFRASGVPDETLQKLLHLRRSQFEIAATESDLRTAEARRNGRVRAQRHRPGG